MEDRYLAVCHPTDVEVEPLKADADEQGMAIRAGLTSESRSIIGDGIGDLSS